MGDHPRSPTLEFHSALGISKNATIKDMCKAYKSLVAFWQPDRHPSNKAEARQKLQQINEAFKAVNETKIRETTDGSANNDPTSPPSPPIDVHYNISTNTYNTYNHHRSMDESFFSQAGILLKSTSKTPRTSTTNSPTQSRSTSPQGRAPSSRSKSTGRRSKSQTVLPVSSTYLSTDASRRSSSPPSNDHVDSKYNSSRSSSETEIHSLAKSPTTRTGATPIVFTQSTAWKTPPPNEIKLVCTLEELCYGCVKKIKITRDVMSHGIVKREEEVLKIKVKPGWRRGTQIRFEGKGNEKPGYFPADIIFLIDEKEHLLFTRKGDDLEYGVEIPLVTALVGCTISVPLLGGESMWLSFDNVIYPGFEKVIKGEGMPNKFDGKRGDLRIKFFVEFPLELSDEKRQEAVSILQDCCWN